MKQSRPIFPFRIQSPSGLSVELNSNGSIRRIDYREILVNLFLGTEMEGGPANIFLRRRSSSMEAVPLLGPGSPAAFTFEEGGAYGEGRFGAVRFQVSFVLAKSAPAWFWNVRLENSGSDDEVVDLVHTQDIALADYGTVRTNEFYTSQYVDHTPLSHPQKGFLAASRQNLSINGRNPLLVIGSLGRAVGYCTDALQFYGLSGRTGGIPPGLSGDLKNTRLQHEHSMAALQDEPLRLRPGETTGRGFFGWFEPDHPAAITADDIRFADMAASLPEASPERRWKKGSGKKAAGSLFSSSPFLEALELSAKEIEDLFGSERLEEEEEKGRLLSFFSGRDRHVVLGTKELEVLRPHGQILRSGDSLVPDEASLTSTAWMGGVFHSMVTQGHVSLNRFLSSARGYLGFFRANGLRIFVETVSRETMQRDSTVFPPLPAPGSPLTFPWRLLGVPSAFEMAPRECRWIYKHPGGLIEVRSKSLAKPHELSLSVRTLSGPSARLLFSFHVAVNGDDGSDPAPVRYVREKGGIFVLPRLDSELGRRFPGGGFRVEPFDPALVERLGGDELLFSDTASRGQPYLCLITAPAEVTGFRLRGSLVAETEENTSRDSGDITPKLRILTPAGAFGADIAGRFQLIFPWFIQNGLIHYLAPRGLEQFTGGGWGTRDICQGPVEMLLALGRPAPVRDLLMRVFSAQNPDGDWPQWFTFFDRDRNIRAGDSHGDVVFWPLLALSQYLCRSEDKTLLETRSPFFHPRGQGEEEAGTIRNHVERALAVIRKRIVPGTRLAAYGHGDWNDSLQPADPAMRDRLCSSWTVTLHFQTLTALAAAFERLGDKTRSQELASEAEGVREDFQKLLIVDGILAGFASFRENEAVEYFLHPRDRKTGLSYRLLPMIHALINDLLTPEQARGHLETISNHLLAPDGARLFDRPMEYRGGPMRFFQRAESAAFFGREIGLLYTHAHLRYAEALWRYGDAPGFLDALSRANFAGIRKIVPSAALRQANCYYSSSDAAFADRYEARARYGRIKTGEIPLEGGWRVYSSGAGIWIRLLVECFLGLRLEKARLTIDPVIPEALDGLQVETELGGAAVHLTFRIGARGCGPVGVALNGIEVPFTRPANPYRTGGAEISMDLVRDWLGKRERSLVVRLG